MTLSKAAIKTIENPNSRVLLRHLRDEILKARNKKPISKAVSYWSRPVYSRLSDLVTPDVPFKWKSPGATDLRKADLFPWWGCSDRNSWFTTSTHLWLPLQYPAAVFRAFPVNGTHVCKENTIAERNVPDLSFVYHLLKSWTDRVTNLGSLENTSRSILTSKVTPQAAGNIIIIGFGASNHRYW